MPYFLSYDKKTGAVTGYVKSSVAGIGLAPRAADEAYVEVTSEDHIKTLSTAHPSMGRLSLRLEGGTLRGLKLEPAFAGSIVLSCDLADLDGDGFAELPADGKSVARIKAQLVGDDQQPVRAEGVTVDFRVTRGSLATRRQEVRESSAVVDLRSTTETVATQITARAPGFREGVLRLEFIPPAEHQALKTTGPRKAS